MFARLHRLRLLPPCTALATLVLAGAVMAEEASVGRVSKVENAAEIVSSAGTVTALVGTEVHPLDELKTGAGARLQVIFADATVLTLGEHASVTIDRYVYEPSAGVGDAALKATAGAFRFATGKIKALKEKSITVSTPVAQIGVRGTEFWGGPTDEKFGVFLVEGEISVTNQAGSVVLSGAGQGTEIPSASDAPGTPAIWPADKVARAIATVALH